MSQRRRSKIGEEGWLLSYADLITNLLIFFVMLLSASQLSRPRFQQIAQSVGGKENPSSLSSIQKNLDQKIQEAGLETSIRTKMTEAGLELSFNSGVVFDTGSAQISHKWEEILTKVLGGLVPYTTNYNLAVEGHSDVVPIVSPNARFPSNWELSSARAMEVRARLETLGIAREKIRVEAYADTKPLPVEETAHLSPDEKLARHRRVVVRIY